MASDGTTSFSNKRRVFREMSFAGKSTPRPDLSALLLEAVDQHRKECMSLRARQGQQFLNTSTAAASMPGGQGQSNINKTGRREISTSKRDKPTADDARQNLGLAGNGSKGKTYMTGPIDATNRACGYKKKQTASNASLENSELTVGFGPFFKHATRALKSSNNTIWPPSSSTLQSKNYNVRSQSLKTIGKADYKPLGVESPGMNACCTNKSQEDGDLDLINNLPYLIVDNDSIDDDIIDGENNFLILAHEKKESGGGGHRAGSNIRRREEGLEKLRKTFTERKHMASQEIFKDGFHGDTLGNNYFKQPRSGNFISHTFSNARHFAGRQRQNEAQPHGDITYYRGKRDTRLSRPTLPAKTETKNTGTCPREARLRKSGRQHRGGITELGNHRSKRASSAEVACPTRSLRLTGATRRARSCGNQDDEQSVSLSPDQARYEPIESRSITHMPQRVRFVPKWDEEYQKPSQQETLNREGEQSIKSRFRRDNSVNPHTASKDHANRHRERPKQKEDSLHTSMFSNVEKQSASFKSAKDVLKPRNCSQSPPHSYKQSRQLSLSLPPMAVPVPISVATSRPQVSTEHPPPEDKNNEVSRSAVKRMKRGKFFRARPNCISIQDKPLGHGGKKFKKLELLKKRPDINFISKSLTQTCEASSSPVPGNPSWLKSCNTKEEQRETTKNDVSRPVSPEKQRLSQNPRGSTGPQSGSGDWKGRKPWINEDNKGRQPFKYHKTAQDATKTPNTSPNRRITGQTRKQSPIKVQTNVKEISPFLIGRSPMGRKKEKEVGKQNRPASFVPGRRGKSARQKPRDRQGFLTSLSGNEDLCGWKSDKPEMLCFLQETPDRVDFRVPRAGERCRFVQHHLENGDSGKRQGHHRALHGPLIEASATGQKQKTRKELRKTTGSRVQSSPPSTRSERHVKPLSLHSRSLNEDRRARIEERQHSNDLHHWKSIKEEIADKIRSKQMRIEEYCFKGKDRKQIACEVLESSNQMAARLVELRKTIDMLQTKVENRNKAMTDIQHCNVQNVLEADCQVWIPTIVDYLKLVAFMGLQLFAQYVFVMK